MSGPFRQGSPGGSGPFGKDGRTTGSVAAPYPAGGSAASGSASPLTFTSGPKGLLFAALATAVVGVVLALVPLFGPMTATSTSYVACAVIAWILCGLVTFVLLGVYTIRDNALRANSVYVAQDLQTVLYRLALGLGGLGVLLTAFEIALWVSKL